MKKLSDKHRRFVAEYLKDQNASQACIRAGYSKKNPNVVGPRLLADVGIRQAIDEALAKLQEEVLVDKKFVILGLKDVALRCRQARPVMEFDREEKCMVPVTEMNDKGEEVGVFEFDSTGANRSLELLGKHLDLFSEKVKIGLDENAADLLDRLARGNARANR